MCHVLFELVAESSDESEIIFKFDDQGLIVDCLPSASYRLFFAEAGVATFAEFGVDCKVRFDHYRIGVLLPNRKIIVLVNDLNFIRQCMRTNLLLLK